MRPDDDGPEHAPAPGLDRLDELAEPLRAGGLDVVMRREGDGDVPAGVDLSAYRIVQEALTNTLRHARATRAEVVLSARPEALEVDVRDNGRRRRGRRGRPRARRDARARGDARRDVRGRAAAGAAAIASTRGCLWRRRR